MSCVATAVIAGATLGALGSAAEGDANLAAGKVGQQNAEFAAERAEKKALEDERIFRLAFRKDMGSQRVAIGGAGITGEGSAIEVLRENARLAEQDATNIRLGGEAETAALRESGRSQARRGKAAAGAASLSAAGTLLSGAGQAIGAG